MDRLSNSLLALFAGLSIGAPTVLEKPRWRRHFDAFGVQGTCVVFQPLEDRYLVLDEAGGRRRLPPAATFEVANALVALETGAIADAAEVFRWDGKPRMCSSWERDHTLGSAMREGAVWMFQEAARRIGKARMREWLERLEYGNADIAGGIDLFWLQGALRISAFEQVSFLYRLSEGRLPATQRAQRLVREALVVERVRGHTLHAKSGTTGHARDPVAWWIGWTERQGRPGAYCALNCRPAPRARHEAGAIARAILREEGLIPPA